MATRCQVPIDIVNLVPVLDGVNVRINVSPYRVGSLFVHVYDENVGRGGCETSLAYSGTSIYKEALMTLKLTRFLDLLLDSLDPLWIRRACLRHSGGPPQ